MKVFIVYSKSPDRMGVCTPATEAETQAYLNELGEGQWVVKDDEPSYGCNSVQGRTHYIFKKA
jgi:hypothetical protein